jgi:nucleoside phosphorylase
MSRTWIISVVLAVPIALGWLYAVGVFFGMAGGESWNVGIYGKFNRTRSVIERMADVQIIDTWQHHDITLEDFGFTILSNSEQTAKVHFLENSSQMKMDDSKDIEAYVRASLQQP